jgi:hypothetical protein
MSRSVRTNGSTRRRHAREALPPLQQHHRLPALVREGAAHSPVKVVSPAEAALGRSDQQTVQSFRSAGALPPGILLSSGGGSGGRPVRRKHPRQRRRARLGPRLLNNDDDGESSATASLAATAASVDSGSFASSWRRRVNDPALSFDLRRRRLPAALGDDDMSVLTASTMASSMSLAGSAAGPAPADPIYAVGTAAWLPARGTSPPRTRSPVRLERATHAPLERPPLPPLRASVAGDHGRGKFLQMQRRSELSTDSAALQRKADLPLFARESGRMRALERRQMLASLGA